MIYVKRILNAEAGDSPRNIGLNEEGAVRFFCFDGNGNKNLTFKYNAQTILGEIKKSGNSYTITGEVFSYVRDNSSVGDILVFTITEELDVYNFKIISKGESDYAKYDNLLNEFGTKAQGTTTHFIFAANNIQGIAKETPLQQIYYGAPGTGKSFEINRKTKGCEDVFRTTFHPDSDYSTFVGAYKPVEEPYTLMQTVSDFTSRQAFTIPVIDPVTGKPAMEKKITYKFVQQAFIKAYIRAWEKMAKCSLSSADSSMLTLSVVASSNPINSSYTQGDTKFQVKKVDNDRVQIEKEVPFKKSAFLAKWKGNKLWDANGDFRLPTGPQSGASVLYAVCKWIADNVEGPLSNSEECFNNGWDLLIKTLLMETVKQGSVSATSLSQEYTISVGADNDTVRIIWTLNSRRDRLKRCYDNEAKCAGAEIGLVDILRKQDSESFDEAWKKLKNINEESSLENDIEVENTEGDDSIFKECTTDPVFLIIEEINRGNCAQIFGDLFQLLDRNDAGFSAYAINADSDLEKELCESLKNVHLNAELAKAINDIYGEHYANIVEKVLSGELLLLPNNLYIWATMNTSDQSLFPIDSAFKRRWDWEYVPIKYNNNSWSIVLGNKKYSWVDFQKKINDRVFDANQSEDKQMGDWFVKADSKNEISESLLLNKIVFYLWNDVCKDGDGDIFKIKTSEDKTEAITFSEFFRGDKTEKLQQWMAYLGISAEGTDGNSVDVVEESDENK